MKVVILIVFQVLFFTLVNGDCPGDFSSWTDGDGNVHGYKAVISEYGLNVYQARPICKALGGDLASIHSQEENDFVINNVPDLSGNSVWIGTYILPQDDGSIKCLLADKSDASFGAYNSLDDTARQNAPWDTSVTPSIEDGSKINCVKLASNLWSEQACDNRIKGVLCKISC